MKSEVKSGFSNLSYDIAPNIFEMHNIQYNIHNNNLKSLHNELKLNFTCKNCNCIKNSYLYKTQYCSMVCYVEASSDYSDDEDYREIQNDYYENKYFKQEYKAVSYTHLTLPTSDLV